jgi:hypothetical protein
MKSSRIILAALAIIAVASAQDVTSNFDQNTDFTKYKTYKWVEIPGGIKVDDSIAATDGSRRRRTAEELPAEEKVSNQPL